MRTILHLLIFPASFAKSDAPVCFVFCPDAGTISMTAVTVSENKKWVFDRRIVILSAGFLPVLHLVFDFFAKVLVVRLLNKTVFHHTFIEFFEACSGAFDSCRRWPHTFSYEVVSKEFGNIETPFWQGYSAGSGKKCADIESCITHMGRYCIVKQAFFSEICFKYL